MLVPEDGDFDGNALVVDVEFDGIDSDDEGELDLTRLPEKLRVRHDRPCSAFHKRRSPQTLLCANTSFQKKPLPAWSSPVLIDPTKETARNQERRRLLQSFSGRLRDRSQVPGSLMSGGSSSSAASPSCILPRARHMAGHVAGRASAAAVRLRADADCIAPSTRNKEAKTANRQAGLASEVWRSSGIGHNGHLQRGIRASSTQGAGTRVRAASEKHVTTNVKSRREGVHPRDADTDDRRLVLQPRPKDVCSTPCLLAQSTRISLLSKQSESVGARKEVVSPRPQTLIYTHRIDHTKYQDEDHYDSQGDTHLDAQPPHERRLATLDNLEVADDATRDSTSRSKELASERTPATAVEVQAPRGSLEETGAVEEVVQDDDDRHELESYREDGDQNDVDNYVHDDDYYLDDDNHDLADNHDDYHEEKRAGNTCASIGVGDASKALLQVRKNTPAQTTYLDPLETRYNGTEQLETWRAASPRSEFAGITSDNLRRSEQPMEESKQTGMECCANVNLGGPAVGSHVELLAGDRDSHGDVMQGKQLELLARREEADGLAIGEHASHMLPGEHVDRHHASIVTGPVVGLIVEESAKSTGMNDFDIHCCVLQAGKCNSGHAAQPVDEKGGEDTPMRKSNSMHADWLADETLQAEQLAISGAAGLAAEQEKHNATMVNTEPPADEAHAALSEEQLATLDAEGSAAMVEDRRAKSMDTAWHRTKAQAAQVEQRFGEHFAKPSSPASTLSRSQHDLYPPTEEFEASTFDARQQAVGLNPTETEETQGALLEKKHERLEVEKLETRAGDKGITAAGVEAADSQFEEHFEGQDVKQFTPVAGDEKFTGYTPEEYTETSLPALQEGMDASRDEELATKIFRGGQLTATCAVAGMTEADELTAGRNADALQPVSLMDRSLAKHVENHLEEDSVMATFAGVRLAEGPATEKTLKSVESEVLVGEASALQAHEFAMAPAITLSVSGGSPVANPENTCLVADAPGIDEVASLDEEGPHAEATLEDDETRQRTPKIFETEQASDHAFVAPSQARELVAEKQKPIMEVASPTAATATDQVEKLVADGTAAVASADFCCYDGEEDANQTVSPESARYDEEKDAQQTLTESVAVEVVCIQPDGAASVKSERSLIEEDPRHDQTGLLDGPRCDAKDEQERTERLEIAEEVGEVEHEQLSVHAASVKSTRSLVEEDPTHDQSGLLEGPRCGVKNERERTDRPEIAEEVGEVEQEQLSVHAASVKSVRSLVEEDSRHDQTGLLDGSRCDAKDEQERTERLEIAEEVGEVEHEQLSVCDFEVEQLASECASNSRVEVEAEELAAAENMESQERTDEVLVPVAEDFLAQQLPLNETSKALVGVEVAGAEEQSGELANSSILSAKPDGGGDHVDVSHCGDAGTPAEKETSSRSGNLPEQPEIQAVDVMSNHSGDWSVPEVADEDVAFQVRSELDDDQFSGQWSDEAEHVLETVEEIEYSGEWSVESGLMHARDLQDLKQAPLDDGEYSGDWSNDDA